MHRSLPRIGAGCDAKGVYNEAYMATMRADSRCAGFPNLLGIKQAAPVSAPPSADCKRRASRVTRLENDTRFDTDVSVRRRWQVAVEDYHALGC